VVECVPSSICTRTSVRDGCLKPDELDAPSGQSWVPASNERRSTGIGQLLRGRLDDVVDLVGRRNTTGKRMPASTGVRHSNW
jgi:hypothetical protein